MSTRPYLRTLIYHAQGNGITGVMSFDRVDAIQRIEDPRPVGGDEREQRETDAAIEAFEFLARLGRECVSNGVLLESQ